MRIPDYTNQFKRDYKREKKGRHRATLDIDLQAVLPALLADLPLEPRHRDHALMRLTPLRPAVIPAQAGITAVECK